MPNIPASPTDNEDLSQAPRALASYRDTLMRSMGPKPYTDFVFGDANWLRRYYYSLLIQTDRQIMRVIECLCANHLSEDTAIVLSADHAGLLKEHGGLLQKFYNAYDESIHVNFTVVLPGALTINPPSIHHLTSHADLVPTLIGLAGVSVTDLRHSLRARGYAAPEFPGRDLSSVILGKKNALSALGDNDVYFVTYDKPLSGTENFPKTIDSQLRLLPISDAWRDSLRSKIFSVLRQLGSYAGPLAAYPPVAGPSQVEALLKYENGTLYKLVRFFEEANPEMGEEWQLFNLSHDPYEQFNVVNAKQHRERVVRLKERLAQKRDAVNGRVLV